MLRQMRQLRQLRLRPDVASCVIAESDLHVMDTRRSSLAARPPAASGSPGASGAHGVATALSDLRLEYRRAPPFPAPTPGRSRHSPRGTHVRPGGLAEPLLMLSYILCLAAEVYRSRARQTHSPLATTVRIVRSNRAGPAACKRTADRTEPVVSGGRVSGARVGLAATALRESERIETRPIGDLFAYLRRARDAAPVFKNARRL